MIVDDAKKRIIRNAKEAFEKEKIVYRADSTGVSDVSELWKNSIISVEKYYELWLHRWLSVYILDKLTCTDNDSQAVNKTKFAKLLTLAVIHMPYYLQRIEKMHLEKSDFRTANLVEDGLQGAHLEGAILAAANLVAANLQGAHLEEANLTLANLNGAIELPMSSDEARARGALVQGDSKDDDL